MNARSRFLCASVVLVAACTPTLEGNGDCRASSECVVDAAMGPAPDLAVPPVPSPDLAMPPPPDLAIPMLDLHQVTVYDNPADVVDWPVTTMITRLDIKPSGVHLEFSKQDGPARW